MSCQTGDDCNMSKSCGIVVASINKSSVSVMSSVIDLLLLVIYSHLYLSKQYRHPR